MPGGLAVATQQANRAHDRERELRQHQQRRDGWLEANAHLGPQYRQVVRTLAWQRRATGLAVEADRPGYVLEALGPVPESTRGRRAWRQAAAEIEQYRRSLPASPIRTGPSAPSRADPSPAGRPAAGPHGHRAGPGQAAGVRPQPRRPADQRAHQPAATWRAAWPAQARSGPPASTTRKEHPDGQFSTVALRRR